MMRVPSLFPPLWFLLAVTLASSDLILDRQDGNECPEGGQKLVLVVEVLVFKTLASAFLVKSGVPSENKSMSKMLLVIWL